MIQRNKSGKWEWVNVTLIFPSLHFFCNPILFGHQSNTMYCLWHSVHSSIGESNSRPYFLDWKKKLLALRDTAYAKMDNTMVLPDWFGADRTDAMGELVTNGPSRRLVGYNTTSHRAGTNRYLYLSSRRGRSSTKVVARPKLERTERGGRYLKRTPCAQPVFLSELREIWVLKSRTTFFFSPLDIEEIWWHCPLRDWLFSPPFWWPHIVILQLSRFYARNLKTWFICGTTVNRRTTIGDRWAMAIWDSAFALFSLLNA